MRSLLTSSGIGNASIRDALVDLLGKPIAESSALCIPTGVQPFPGGPWHVYRFISGSTERPMCGLGWKSLGVLELAALPSIRKEHWVPGHGRQHRTMGRRVVGAGVRDRRSDRHQGGRRRRRGRLRGAMEAAPPSREAS